MTVYQAATIAVILAGSTAALQNGAYAASQQDRSDRTERVLVCKDGGRIFNPGRIEPSKRRCTYTTVQPDVAQLERRQEATPLSAN